VASLESTCEGWARRLWPAVAVEGLGRGEGKAGEQRVTKVATGANDSRDKGSGKGEREEGRARQGRVWFGKGPRDGPGWCSYAPSGPPPHDLLHASVTQPIHYTITRACVSLSIRTINLLFRFDALSHGIKTFTSLCRGVVRCSRTQPPQTSFWT
jgi:hypothetical protein